MGINDLGMMLLP